MQNASALVSDSSARTRGWICSTIGRRQLIAITGLALSGFVLTHMLGNMLILVGAEKYNAYAHALETNPLLPIAEGGLVLAFLAHLIFALWVSWKNWNARQTGYAVMSHGAKRTTWTQRSLWAQGLVILVFTILHLITFKYGPEYTVTYGQTQMRDLHRLVIEVFQQPLYVGWYIVALIILFFHLSHGVGSSLQTLGVNHPRYNGAIKCLSWAYATIVILGFLSQPIYVYFIRG